MQTLSDPHSAAPVDAAPWTVLCVDDEPNIVQALRRLFRGSGYRVLTALSAAEALQTMSVEQVDLLISDMRMPLMDGAALLEQVRARWPATTRMLLTGYADVASSVAAINRGEVYRYLTKPWDEAEILMNVRQAFERQALEREAMRLRQLAERQNEELKALNASLEQRVEARTAELAESGTKIKRNYLNSIKVFSDLAGLRSGPLVGHARRVADIARRIAFKVGMTHAQATDVFVAGLLHDIGHISLPDTLLTKTVPRLNDAETTQYRKHTLLAEQALMPLDDSQHVLAMVRSHHERHDGRGFPDGLAGDAIPPGARILAVADAYDDLQNGHVLAKGLSQAESLTLLQRGKGTQFHPEVVDALLAMIAEMAPRAAPEPVATTTADLRPGLVLASDLRSPDGVMLLTAGQALTVDLIQRIRSYEARAGLVLLLSIQPATRN